jgi:hypothetical protein
MRISDNRETDGIITVVEVDVFLTIICDVVPIISSCQTGMAVTRQSFQEDQGAL